MTDVYKIGVKLAMTSNAGQVLSVLGKEMLGLHAKVKDLEGGLNRVKLALAGALAVGAGAALAASFKAPIDKAMEFERVVARFGQFGLGSKLNADAVNFAKSMNIAGQSYTDAMRNMVEAQGVFRESGLSGPSALAGAKLAAPMLGKIDFANRVLDPDRQGSRHASAMDMLRFIEMKGGANNPRLFNSIANSGYKAITSSGGNVNWSLYRQFMATGGVAAQGLSNDALFGQMEPVIGELKSRAGTALMTAFNRLTGITRVPNQVAHDLVKAGLWDGSKIQWNAMGGVKAITGNPLKDMATFSGSQFDWYTKNVLPYYQSQHMSKPDMDRMDALIGGRTGGMEFSIFRRQAGPIMASLASQQKAMGVDDSYNAAKHTTAGKFADAQAKFNNLMISYGSAILPLVNKALDKLLPMMQGLATWMNKHAAIVKVLAVEIAGLSAVLITAGMVAVAIATGPIALWVAGIALVGTAVAVTVTRISNWYNAMGGISGAISSFIGRLTDLWNFFTGHGSADQANKGNIAGGNALGRGRGNGSLGSFRPMAHGSAIVIHNVTHLDGKKVADNTVRYFGSAMGRPNAGTTGFDSSRSMPQVAAG